MATTDHEHLSHRDHSAPTDMPPTEGAEDGPGHTHGHSHDHSVGPDSAVMANRQAMRALAISLGGLMATALAQAAIVALSGSVALLADTVHNFADALTAIPLAIAFWIGRRPRTRRYTYGYGRAEDLAGVFIVAAIAGSAAVSAIEAIRRLANPAELRHVGWVLVAGVVGFAGNEAVAIYRIRAGKRLGSAALVADGYHARTDGVTSLGVVVSAVGVMLGFELADPVVGLLITLVILGLLRVAAVEIYRRMMDAVDPDIIDRAEAAVRGVDGVRAVDDVRMRWIGHRLRAEVTIQSDSDLTLAAAHDIADAAAEALRADLPQLDRVQVHSNPCEGPEVATDGAASDGGGAPPGARSGGATASRRRRPVQRPPRA